MWCSTWPTRSRFCTLVRFWNRARPRASSKAAACRKSTWGPSDAMAILDVQDVHTYYGEAYVLQGLSLQLEQGQILGLLGRNGVGKTTLVNSIVGFNPPRRGKVVFKGEDITHRASFETVRGGMGLVPQGRRVFPTLGVEENLWSPSAARNGTTGISSASSSYFRGCTSAATSGQKRCPAASNRCWRSAVR